MTMTERLALLRKVREAKTVDQLLAAERQRLAASRRER